MAKKEIYDATNPEHIERRRQEVAENLAKQQEGLRKILDTYHGRAYIWRQLAECGVFKTSFTGDAEHTFFNEGRRDIGIKMLEEVLTISPKAFTLMQSEAVDRQNKEIFF